MLKVFKLKQIPQGSSCHVDALATLVVVHETISTWAIIVTILSEANIQEPKLDINQVNTLRYIFSSPYTFSICRKGFSKKIET